jgi:hypothetical protein
VKVWTPGWMAAVAAGAHVVLAVTFKGFGRPTAASALAVPTAHAPISANRTAKQVNLGDLTRTFLLASKTVGRSLQNLIQVDG